MLKWAQFSNVKKNDNDSFHIYASFVCKLYTTADFFFTIMQIIPELTKISNKSNLLQSLRQTKENLSGLFLWSQLKIISDMATLVPLWLQLKFKKMQMAKIFTCHVWIGCFEFLLYSNRLNFKIVQLFSHFLV